MAVLVSAAADHNRNRVLPAPTATDALLDAPQPHTTADTQTAGAEAATARPPRVLTVCLGNVCRSPAAAAMLRESAAAAGATIEVDSAGTSVASPGRPANRRMRRAAARAGLAITSRTRQVCPDDLYDFDLIVAMDRRNLADLVALRAAHGGTATIRMLRTFDPHASTTEVPDPFRAPPSFHDSVLACMAGAMDGIVAWTTGQELATTSRAA